MSTTQLLRYPLTREKILASCHGLTSAGNISPSAGAPTLGDTTDTFGTASCLVSAVACWCCDSRGNTPASTARDNKTTPTIISRRAPRVPKNGGFPVDGSLCPINQLLLRAVMFIRYFPC